MPMIRPAKAKPKPRYFPCKRPNLFDMQPQFERLTDDQCEDIKGLNTLLKIPRYKVPKSPDNVNYVILEQYCVKLPASMMLTFAL